MAEEIALHLGAADRLQHVHLLLRLHALGRRGHIEAFGESGDGVDDRQRLGAIGEILNEGATI